MKIRNTLVLMGVFIVLAGYVYFVEVKQYEEEQQQKEFAKQVFNFNKDSLAVLKFRNNNGSFTLEKIQDEWRITKPLYTDADKSTITSMISSLSGAKKQRTFSIISGQLGEYGLDKPAVTVQVQLTNGEKDSLLLGDKTPVGSYVFSNKTDTLVFTVNQSVKNMFNKTLFSLRDKRPLQFKRVQVRRMIVDNPYGSFEFEKSGASDWMLRNINRPARPGNLNNILNKLESNQIKDFVDETGDDLQQYGLSNPPYRIELFLGPEQGQKRLIIGSPVEGKVFAKDDSRKPIFEIDTTLVKLVRKREKDFREIDFVDFSRSQVNRVDLSYDTTRIICVKDTSDNWWMGEGPNRQPAQKNKISSLFSTLDFTQIKEFVKDGPYNKAAYGLDEPALKIALYQDDNLMVEAAFGKKKGDNVYAATSQYQSVYLIPASKVKEMKLNRDALRAAPPEKEEGKKPA